MNPFLSFALGIVVALAFSAWRRAVRHKRASRRLLVFLTPRLLVDNHRRDVRRGMSALPDSFWNSPN